HRRQPAVLPVAHPQAVPGHHPRHRQGRAGRPGLGPRVLPDRGREALRPRPGLGPRAPGAGDHRLPRAGRVPDRPLPGQGERLEHHRVPLRQRDLRAGLEPPLRRPPPGHRLRVARHRAPRTLLRAARSARDIAQNHHLQGVALVTREPPGTFEPEDVRNEKAKVLKALRRLEGEAVDGQVVRGQYGPGWIDGKEAPGYREEPDVHPDSVVETYVAAELRVDNWRWAGTPFYVRTGKRLPKRATEVVVQFKSAPHLPFGEAAQDGLEPNALVLRIQPDEGITMRIGAKVPGPSMEVRSVSMDFSYGTSFSDDLPDAYERLLLDVMLGDPTLFPPWARAQQAWRAVQPILDRWAEAPPPDLPNYEAGSWGPKEADE